MVYDNATMLDTHKNPMVDNTIIDVSKSYTDFLLCHDPLVAKLFSYWLPSCFSSSKQFWNYFFIIVTGSGFNKIPMVET